MKGGFWDTLTNAWESTKKAASDAYGSATGSTTTTTTSSYVPPPPATTTTTYVAPTSGGRKRSKKMRGGYGDNISLTNLASRAAPISDIKSAQPLTTVGGRRTKRHRRHRHGKSCKHRKY
jgi:hypothetical protein